MAIFYMNGGSASSDRGWVGWTGSNNYVVCYPFTTGSSGASSVTLPLNYIYTQKGSGGQSFGFKIGSSATEYANAHQVTPDSNTATLSYSGSTYGYTATLSASCNLTANTTYYLFVYVVSSGTEYYGGTWNLTAPNITTSGSYTAPDSTLQSISSSVYTQQAVSIVMNNPNSLQHTVTFSYAGKTLASASFTTTLSYTCPRSWMANNISVTSMSITATIQISSSGKTVATRSFTLYADSGMAPVLSSSSVTASAVNTGSSFTSFIAGVSKAAISFVTGNIDMSSTASAELRSYSVSINGKIYSGKSVTTDVILATCTARCTATDSRGRSGYVDITITAVAYTAPSLNSMNVFRCTAAGAESETGAYVSCYAKCTYTAITEGSLSNAATITAAYQVEGQSTWTTLGTLNPDETKLFNHGDTTNALSVRLTVTDTVGQTNYYETQIAHEQWMLCFRPGGDGAAIGMSASIADQLSIPSDWDYASGSAKFGHNEMVLIDGKHYGTDDPEDTISNPVVGQIYFKVID